MKTFPGFFLAALLLGVSQSSNAAADVVVRNNCYALLHQLLDEQKDVSLLRLIKKEQVDLKDLTKRIAAASAAGSKLLEEFTARDPGIDLKGIDLPAGEVAVRDAIAATKKKELLSEKGDEFELTLLLSQTEALSYASHLADVACENEVVDGRAQALASISKDMRGFYREAFDMMMRNPAARSVK